MLGEFPFSSVLQRLTSAVEPVFQAKSAEQILAEGGIPKSVLGQAGAASLGFDEAALNTLIDRFNRYFEQEVTPENARTMLFYVTQVYNEIVNTFGAYLTEAQAEGLMVKMIAYQDRVKRVEAGLGDPHVSGGSVAVDLPFGLTLPSLSSSVSIMGVKIPAWYLYTGAAVAALIIGGRK